MPPLRETAKYVKELNEIDFWVLKNIFILSKNYERVPLQILVSKGKFKADVIMKSIKKLHRHGFIEYFLQPYESIRLYTSGADLLALKKFSEKGLIAGIGRQIGVGKESDIYEVIDDEGRRYSLKIFRIGRISFRQVRVKRKYGRIDIWTSWLNRNINAAKNEYRVLKQLYLRGAPVPRPVYKIMHMILLEFLDGDILNKVKLPEKEVKKVYEIIIGYVKRIYELGYVNGDLSQFNVFVKNTGDIILIDWPQAIEVDKNEQLARQLLIRDLKNITHYFVKTYHLNMDFISDVLSTNNFSDLIDLII